MRERFTSNYPGPSYTQCWASMRVWYVRTGNVAFDVSDLREVLHRADGTSHLLKAHFKSFRCTLVVKPHVLVEVRMPALPCIPAPPTTA